MSIPESFWSGLLDRIEEGRVIPVIGSSLTESVLDGEKATLEGHLARRLARQLDLQDCGAGAAEPSLFEVVACAHRGDREGDYHTRVHRLLRQLGTLVPPSPELASLARIADFRLYLSLGFDDLLLRALDDERGLADAAAHHLAYAPNQTRTDLPAAYKDLREPLVYSLFGKSCAAPEFVISEEDLVEWVTALLDPDNRPHLLFDALRANHLLFIGCRLSDWLMRFFIRMTRESRFSFSRGDETLIGLPSGEGGPLVSFLDRFSPRTRVIEVEPAGFAAELAERWSRRRGEARAKPGRPLPADIRPGGVFLSYSREDQAAARRVHDALTARQIDVYFDERRLAGGASFENAIGRNIGRCGVFLPILSAGLLARLRRWQDEGGGRAESRPFFFQEWELALARRMLQPEAMAIVPLRLDSFDLRDPLIPEGLRSLSFVDAFGGETDARLLDTVKQAVRDARRQRWEAR